MKRATDIQRPVPLKPGIAGTLVRDFSKMVKPPPTRDRRMAVVLCIAVAIAVTGYLLALAPGRGIEATQKAAFGGLTTTAAADSSVPDEKRAPFPELAPAARQALETAEQEISKGNFESAIKVLNSAQPQLRNVARAYEMLGRSLEGRGDYSTARDFYLAAIDRDPFLSDAYWGVATSSENLGEIEAALGAMRSYLHTEPDRDPNRLRIAQARSAIWEWEAQLGRGPWGPTKGIPPGFTADEIKRDGRGVGIKVAIPGTERPDGSAEAEMKHQEKFQIFSRP